MTYWMLATGVCLSVFFIALLCGFAALSAGQNMVERCLRSSSARTAANLLFALKISPLVFALIASLGLALPAFFEFEPRVTNEGVGTRLWVLSLLGLSVLGAMIIRGVRIFRATGALERSWTRNSSRHEVMIAGRRLTVFSVGEESSLLAVAGLLRPRIFVSSQVTSVLSREELSAALQHEVAHIGFLDNFKQWLLKIATPPRWLDASGSGALAWANASEAAADEAALRNGVSALDLAGALVKVARLRSDPAIAGASAVSHLIPALPDYCLQARVSRLQAALEDPAGNHGDPSRAVQIRIALLIASPVAVYAACATVLLPLIHDALEFLVR
jgi:hypothetical protein